MNRGDYVSWSTSIALGATPQEILDKAPNGILGPSADDDEL